MKSFSKMTTKIVPVGNESIQPFARTALVDIMANIKLADGSFKKADLLAAIVRSVVTSKENSFLSNKIVDKTFADYSENPKVRRADLVNFIQEKLLKSSFPNTSEFIDNFGLIGNSEVSGYGQTIAAARECFKGFNLFLTIKQAKKKGYLPDDLIISFNKERLPFGYTYDPVKKIHITNDTKNICCDFVLFLSNSETKEKHYIGLDDKERDYFPSGRGAGEITSYAGLGPKIEDILQKTLTDLSRLINKKLSTKLTKQKISEVNIQKTESILRNYSIKISDLAQNIYTSQQEKVDEYQLLTLKFIFDLSSLKINTSFQEKPSTFSNYRLGMVVEQVSQTRMGKFFYDDISKIPTIKVLDSATTRLWDNMNIISSELSTKVKQKNSLYINYCDESRAKPKEVSSETINIMQKEVIKELNKFGGITSKYKGDNLSPFAVRQFVLSTKRGFSKTDSNITDIF